MKVAHYYRLESGEFVGVTMAAPDDEVIAANAPEGCGWYVGDVDPRRQRVVHLADDFGDMQQALAPWQAPKPQDTALQQWLWSEAAEEWLPQPTAQALVAAAKAERAARLAACDWVVTKAQETEQPVPKAWREYRQALRDVTTQPGFPTEVVWPKEPE